MNAMKGAFAGFVMAAAMLVSSSALSQTVLTFEGLKDQEPVNNFYNGGTGGLGSGPGGNFGITFTPTSLAIIEAAQGGSGNFSGEPSPKTILFFLTGTATMNVASGFTNGFSFYYSAVNQPGVVNVWSGPNATGTMLASLALPVTPSGGPGCTGSFCPWFPIGVTFSGTAHSVDFGGTVNQIGFDNITIGSATPGGASNPTVPTLGDPALIALAILLSLIGMVAVARYRKR
jgi:hypothetical protein